MKNRILLCIRNHRKAIMSSILIQNYIEGELHGEAFERFKIRILFDTELAIEVNLYREIDEFLKNNIDLSRSMNNWSKYIKR